MSDTELLTVSQLTGELASYIAAYDQALFELPAGATRPGGITEGSVWINNTLVPWPVYLYNSGVDTLLGHMQPVSRIFTPLDAGQSLITGLQLENNPNIFADMMPFYHAASNSMRKAYMSTLSGKMFDVKPFVNAIDYGAKGDGIQDDTTFIQAALDDGFNVVLPRGDFLLTAPLVLGETQSLEGAGYGTVLRCRAAAFDKETAVPYWNTTFDCIHMVSRSGRVANLRIVGANRGIFLSGPTSETTNNIIENIEIWDTVIGVELHTPANGNPVYWNNFTNVLVERPRDMGFYLVSDADDGPNENRFVGCRVYSHGTAMVNTRIGFNINNGRFGNTFVNCGGDLHPNFIACVRFGAATSGNQMLDLAFEALGPGHGIWMETGAGSDFPGGMLFINCYLNVAGASLYDPSQMRRYTAINCGNNLTGQPINNHYFSGLAKFANVSIENFFGTTINYDPGTSTDFVLEANVMTYRCSAFGGAYRAKLPIPSEAIAGIRKEIIKTDISTNEITVSIVGNNNDGPNGRPFYLSDPGDIVTVECNGADWKILFTNKPWEGTRDHAATAAAQTIDINPNIPFHRVSTTGYTGTIAQLRPAASYPGKRVEIVQALGPAFTIPGVEGGTITMDAQYKSAAFRSDGNLWHKLYVL